MRIATFNICWWKSAVNKWLFELFESLQIDILTIQELKTKNVEVPLPYYKFKFIFNKINHQWTGIISREAPSNIKYEVWFKNFDDEKRFIEIEFEKFYLINVYMPHWWRDKRNLEYKLKSFDFLINYLKTLKKPVILVWDFNVAHKEIDLAKPKQNKNNIMFLPEEREKIDEIINLWFVDSFRLFNKNLSKYTWWLRAFDAKNRNIWWRIDYIFVSKELEKCIVDVDTIPSNISDHCPLFIDINI